MALKGLKNRSPVGKARWQSVREERRLILKTEAKRNKRARYTEEKKITERERSREQRANLTEEEAAAATKRNTDRRRICIANLKQDIQPKLFTILIKPANRI